MGKGATKGPEPFLYFSRGPGMGFRLNPSSIFGRRNLEEPVFGKNWRFPPPISWKAVFITKTDKATWCDNVSTIDVEKTCGQLADAGLLAALAELRENHGADMASWEWSTAHPVVNRHIPGSFLPLIGEGLSIIRPSSGGNHTINRGQHVISSDNPFDNVHAAGFRAVYDLGNLDDSRYMISTGQSGNPFSQSYDNLATGWTEGDSIAIKTNRDEIGPTARLILRAEKTTTE